MKGNSFKFDVKTYNIIYIKIIKLFINAYQLYLWFNIFIYYNRLKKKIKKFGFK